MIRPALTAEEWKEARASWPADEDRSTRGQAYLTGMLPTKGGNELVIDEWPTPDQPTEYVKTCVSSLGRHKVAALALYGQPFGFTREETERLRAIADAIRNVHENWDAKAFLEDLADKIDALLPRQSAK